MYLDVYDIDLVHVGRIYTWVSLVWEGQYNAEGSFQLEVQPADGITDLFRVDRYCTIDQSDEVMVIKSIDISDTIVINGFTASHILTERVFTNTVESGNAEQMMREIVSTYCADWPCLELGVVAGIDAAYSHAVSDGTVFDKVQKIAQETDIGFRVRKLGKKLLFECFQPKANPNLKFAERYGNLGEVTYAKSTIQYKNVAVVAGQGEGEDRVTVIAGDAQAKGAARREIYVDARSVQQDTEGGETMAQYIERLKAHGLEKLIEQVEIETVSFSVTGDVQIGEIITVMMDNFGLTVTARVTNIKLTSQNNTTKKEIGVGTPISIDRS